MDSFFISGDKAQEAKEEFRVYFQTDNSNTRDTQNSGESNILYVFCKRRWTIIDVERKAL